MDIKGFLSGLVAQGNTGGTHPVTKPDFTLSYENKDITGDIAPYLISFVYTDYLEGQSDELQVEFEDVDGRWLRGWYPEQGDALSLSLGDQFTGLVALGSFEIAEIEYNHPPSTVSMKALAAGISKASRTLKGRAYENTTLAEIVRQVAARLKLEPSGQVKDIKIKRITQYQERDIEFLSRLAKEYGHTFKIVGNKLVFADNATLKEREVVVVLSPEDMTRIRLRDLIKGVPTQVEMRGYDPKTKKTVSATRKTKSLRPKSKRGHTGDTLKIVPNKGESQAQLNARADAKLAEAQDDQCAGNITLFGNALLVAGQTVRLKNMGKFSGKYLVKQARHEYRSNSGYTTELEIKMIEYIDDEEQQDATNP
ncbi:TPA: phage late control D family protein [Neisseria subflava]